MLGRHENVRALMETSPTLAMVKDKLNMIPLGYACKFGHLETVKLFSEFKFKVNAGIG